MISSKNKYLKIISAGLSALMFATTLIQSTPANASAIPDNIIAKDTSNTNKENVLKSFYNQHPTVSKLGIAAGAVAGFIGVVELGKLVHREWVLRDVTTKIDQYVKEGTVQLHLNEEIDKYKSRANDVFEIDPQLIKESDPRALLLTVMKLNHLFEKYSGFKTGFIEYKRQKHQTFCLKLATYKEYGFMSLLVKQLTEPDLSAIAVGNLKHFKKSLYKIKKAVDSGYWSPRNEDELIDSAITHEFGHLMFIFYLIQQGTFTPVTNASALRKAKGDDKKQLEQQAIEAQKTLMLQSKEVMGQIIDPDTGIPDYTIRLISPLLFKLFESTDEKIPEGLTFVNSMHGFSDYGATSPQEAFAEIFAHLECSDCDKIVDKGQELENFLVKEGYLPPESSYFCKQMATPVSTS